MSLEASDSAGFEAFCPKTGPAIKRIRAAKGPPQKKTVLFIIIPPKFQVHQDREHPVRPRAARKLSKTIPLEEMSGLRPPADRTSAIRYELLSNRKATPMPAQAPELYPET
jgi:hypothetical protein